MKSIKCGIMLPHYGPSQLAFFVISQINNISNQYPEYDFCLFLDNVVRPAILPNCAVMHANEIFSFDGVLISTTIDGAIASSKAINRAKNIFYVWDLEWLRGKNDFLHNIQAYRNPNIHLIARSDNHKNAIENYSNRIVGHVIENINIMEILKLCQTQTK